MIGAICRNITIANAVGLMIMLVVLLVRSLLALHMTPSQLNRQGTLPQNTRTHAVQIVRAVLGGALRTGNIQSASCALQHADIAAWRCYALNHFLSKNFHGTCKGLVLIFALSHLAHLQRMQKVP